MPRNYTVYLNDIMESISLVENYTRGLSFEVFSQDRKTQDAVVRQLEIIGEATKQIPESMRQIRTDVEWRKIADLRDILVHQYFKVDLQIVWDIVKNKLLILQTAIKELMEHSNDEL